MLQERVYNDETTVNGIGKANRIADRKYKLSELKKALSEYKVRSNIQVTCYKLYNEMYNVNRYFSTETTAYVIQQRLCNEEVQTNIQSHIPVTE